MISGQVEDLEATGGAADAERLERIHRAKTGALLTASVTLGAVLAGAEGEGLARFSAFGAGLGLLFQIADDILDVTGTAASLGKSPGKDEAAGKLTYPRVFGLDAARRKLAELAGSLSVEAVGLEGEGGVLAALVEYVARRDR